MITLSLKYPIILSHYVTTTRLYLSHASNEVLREIRLVMEEGSFSLGPECEVLWSSTNKDLGGGQHVEGPERRPSLLVLVIHGQSNLGADDRFLDYFISKRQSPKLW